MTTLIAGGEIVAAGAPEDGAQVAKSYTGQFLKGMLKAPKTGAKASAAKKKATRKRRAA